MHRFVRSAPLDFTLHSPPSIEERAGTPLTQGFLFTLLSTVAGDRLPVEVADQLSALDPNAWYHGQTLETLLNDLEQRDAAAPLFLGRTIYFMLRDLLQQAGLKSASAVVEGLPFLWHQATRGDCGEWRSRMVAPHHAHIELAQPYNCRFEEGAVHGFIEAFGGRDIHIEHDPCMRHGSPMCVLEVSWAE